MSERRPKFPNLLPPPMEVIEGPRYVNLMEKDLQSINKIEDLVSDLYWFSEDHYYLFFRFGEGVHSNLQYMFDNYGIASKTTELYFYKHPIPAYENDFVRVLPTEHTHEWQRQAAAGRMYGRVMLSLEAWRKRQLDITQIAQTTASAIVSNQPILDLKPGLWGFSLNLRSLYRRVKVFLTKKIK
jgi:hypothetical protein